MEDLLLLGRLWLVVESSRSCCRINCDCKARVIGMCWKAQQQRPMAVPTLQTPAPAPSAIQPSALRSPPQGPFAAATVGTPSLLRQLLLQLLLGKGVYSDIADSQVGGGEDDLLKGVQALLKTRQMVALLSQAC
ncbi:MAG: hypothetical protein FRX49_07141 [Trebouxia sp. A1-2]|nr:MAG: hypothetical protein FRX49_07141 [Trebouxia sp. A1-2]